MSACCLGSALVLRQSWTQRYFFAFVSSSSRRVEGSNESAAISVFSKMSALRSGPGDPTGAAAGATGWAGVLWPPGGAPDGDSSSGSPSPS